MVGWNSRLTTQYLLKLDVGDVERVLAFRPYRPPPVEESPSLPYQHGWVRHRSQVIQRRSREKQYRAVAFNRSSSALLTWRRVFPSRLRTSNCCPFLVSVTLALPPWSKPGPSCPRRFARGSWRWSGRPSGDETDLPKRWIDREGNAPNRDPRSAPGQRDRRSVGGLRRQHPCRVATTNNPARSSPRLRPAPGRMARGLPPPRRSSRSES